MRKFILLFCAVGFLSFTAHSQVTLYNENFDTLPHNVIQGQVGAPPLMWNDTNNIFRSAGQSFHLQPSRATPPQTPTEIWFETPSFSTVGNPYVFMEFTHICKLYFLNSGKVEISTDGGTVWNVIDEIYYKGSTAGPGQYRSNPVGTGAEQFNESTYFGQSNLWQFQTNSTPTNAWWVTEQFDLTGAASNATVPGNFVGYPDVRIRFKATINNLSPTGYYAGWWIDDIKITASPCELDPPKINFNFTTLPKCIQNKPENNLIYDPFNPFEVAVRVTDAGGYNTGVDSVSLYYSVNGATPFSRKTIPTYPSGVNEFRTDFGTVLVGDTVRWYIVAEDVGCPTPNLNNSTRSPDLLYFTQTSLDTQKYRGFYTFWADSSAPAKCGSPYCGAYPFVQQSFPYIIDFENARWGATGTVRGVPVGQPHYFENNPSTGAPGWTVGTGSTPNSPFTGPTADHTTGTSTGKYLFLESTSLNTDAQFNTPCINLKNAPNCLSMEFWYHMYGADIGEIRIEIDTGVGNQQNYFKKKYLVISGQQQLNQSDSWQKAVVDLNPFIGQIIRIRFRGYTNGGFGDIAIDDIKLFQPDTMDVEILSNDFPKNGFCDYVNEPVKIKVRNNACLLLNKIPVAYQYFDGTSLVTRWDTVRTPLGLGDTTSFTFTQPVTFTGFGTYQLKTWANLAGDQNRSNDTASGQVINYVQPINTFPFIEDFETGSYLTQNLGNNWFVFTNGVKPNFRWQVGKELTQTRNSGPSTGYHHQGQYLYAESNATSGNATTYMRTQCVDLSSFNVGDPVVVEFFYHGYGTNINKLEVQVSKATEDLNTWTTLPGGTIASGQMPQNFELNEWSFKRVDLSAYSGQDIKLRFAVTRTGSGDKTNFAIDKVRIYKLLANDAGAYTIDKPGGTATIANTKAGKVTIINYGSTTLNTCSVHYKVTPLCGTNRTPVVYSEYFTGLNIASGGSAQVTMNGAPATYPAGEMRITAYTSNVNGTNSTTGDSYRFNDTIYRNVTGIQEYDIPFANNFDNCDYEEFGTFADRSASNPGAPYLLQWELGTPAVTNNPSNIKTPRSSPNAWVTNLDGNFLVGTREALKMPVFDKFDTVFKAELRFWQNIDFGQSVGQTSYDVAGTVLYYNLGNYEVLGGQFQSPNIGVNWHGTCIGTPASTLFGGGPAFVASTTPKPSCISNSGGAWQNGWIYTMFPLDEFNGDTISKLQMAFEFASSSSMAQSSARGGWGIDDFAIYIPPQNSAHPHDVYTVSPLPFPGVRQKLEVVIENTGGKVLNDCVYDVYVDGIIGGTKLNTTPIPFPNPISRPWFRGDLRKDTVRVWWPAHLVTSGQHEICIITSRPNGKKDNLMADDTLCKTISVIKEVDITSIGDFNYCDDFETANDYKWITKNANDYSSKTSWEEGTPVQFNGAHSGTNAWMTGLNKNYIDGDASALFTPVFLVDSGQVYEINFWHQLQSEKYHDGGNVEYSLDGGVTFYPIGWSSPGKPLWYNTPFVTALSQIRGGWTDTTNGWIEAKQRIAFAFDTKVILRFRFGADFDLNDIGWAIDDFCISKDTVSAGPDGPYFGVNEPELPSNVIVGYLSPNPAQENSTLGIFLPEPKVMSVKVFNVVGQMITSSEKKYQEGLSQIEFDTNSWKSGIYFITVEYDGNSVTRKLVISQ